MGAVISAMGAYVPPHVIDNDQVSAWTGRSPDWIEQRTGILTRRYAADDCPTSVLAHHAVQNMLSRDPAALDGVSAIIVATSTPDRPQPPTAAVLQGLLGLSGVPAFDLQAVCVGWLAGVQVAAALAESRAASVLLVAADKYSTILDRADPTTASLFGDGAAATVVRPGPDGRGLRALLLETHGEHADLVTVAAGGSERPTSPNPADYCFRMYGREVKRYALDNLPPLVRRACAQAGVALADLGAVLCHQANVRLLHDLADALGVDAALLPLTAPQFGNTGAASLPLTLVAAQDDDRLTPGRPVALCAIGGGMALGAGVYVP